MDYLFLLLLTIPLGYLVLTIVWFVRTRPGMDICGSSETAVQTDIGAIQGEEKENEPMDQVSRGR
jgi:hypothetical protein